MRFYRVYGLDRADCIETISLIAADDDRDAMRQAECESGFEAVEVWDQSRRVGRIGVPAGAVLAPAEMGRRAQTASLAALSDQIRAS